MPDIAMCHGGQCPRKGTCYRFTATPTPDRQGYFKTPPFASNGACNYYLPNRSEDKKP